MQRECGDCTLCCKLLPVKALDKGANERCKHQRHTGCRIYGSSEMPWECRAWNCRWLVGNAGETSRPDRSHLVIDVMPDFVTATDNKTGEVYQVEVVQVWCDPRYPDAHRDPTFRAYAAKEVEDGKLILVRYNARDAVTLLMTGDGNWHELSGKSTEKTHSFLEIAQALSHG